ncbi:MAG TPA: alkaline phosphatase family protein [Actinomycetota bacterium]|jgi:hypothetical protein
MPRRPLPTAIAVVMLLGVACTSAGDGPHSSDPSAALATTGGAGPAAESALAAKVCTLPRNWLVETWRGWRQDRAGQIQILPTLPNFVAGDGIYPHAGPWPYLEDVPMLWYGPGYIRSQGTVRRPVTSADVAPTVADLLHFRFDAPDGKPMTEALVPAAQRKTPPRLILTVVYDAGGLVVLNRWPEQHPNLDRLEKEGTYYSHATVGSNPTSTAQIHATIGTGAYPRLHGIVGNHMLMNGHVRAPWADGPSDLLLPTLGDEYDKAMGNKPLVGLAATASFHLGMMSHGSELPGGDKDIAVLHGGRNSVKWGLGGANGQYYSFPSYVNDLPPLSTYFPVADASDGKMDGLWRGKVISQVRGGFDTPARLPFQTNVVRNVIQREGFGRDDVPDLFYLNYKLIDEVGHIWNLDSPEMHDTVKVQDNQLPQLIKILNTDVGRGKWVMVLTADHGHTPDPRTTGAIRIAKTRVQPLIQQRFGKPGVGPLIKSFQPTWLFMNMDNVKKAGTSLTAISNYIMTLTKSQVATTGSTIPPGTATDPAFRIAYPSTMIDHLPCLKIPPPETG